MIAGTEGIPSAIDGLGILMAQLSSRLLTAPGGANEGIEVSREGFSPRLESTDFLSSPIILGGDGIEAPEYSKDELLAFSEGTDCARALSKIGRALERKIGKTSIERYRETQGEDIFS